MNVIRRNQKFLFISFLALALLAFAFSYPFEAEATTCDAGIVVGSQCQVYLTSGTSWTILFNDFTEDNDR